MREQLHFGLSLVAHSRDTQESYQIIRSGMFSDNEVVSDPLGYPHAQDVAQPKAVDNVTLTRWMLCRGIFPYIPPYKRSLGETGKLVLYQDDRERLPGMLYLRRCL